MLELSQSHLVVKSSPRSKRLGILIIILISGITFFVYSLFVFSFWIYVKNVAAKLAYWLHPMLADMVDGSRFYILSRHFGGHRINPLDRDFHGQALCKGVEMLRDAEEYKNFCDRPRDQRPQPEEVIGNGATYCTSELAVLKNNEIHAWDRGYDDDGNQVWGVKGGPYEFKPAPASSFDDVLNPLSFASQPVGKRIEGSFVLQE
ncbi:hypothetical protein HAX54_003554 [Datura stramonium]|uniref:Uncharacterized protein n=1 Tax=Datura stramonium TaxID=4076 RepID=A0ABS8T667_DATST|nr:hypothetical protein [Datura stramonium]